jgi:hypothetical protein
MTVIHLIRAGATTVNTRFTVPESWRKFSDFSGMQRFNNCRMVGGKTLQVVPIDVWRAASFSMISALEGRTVNMHYNPLTGWQEAV